MARRISTLFGLFLTLVLPLASVIPGVGALLRVPGLGAGAGREAFWWVLGAVVVVYVVAVERRPLLSIGLKRPDFRTVIYGIAACAVIVLGVGVLLGLLVQALHLKSDTAAVQKLLSLPFGLRVAMVVRAGIVEELFFRGYGIERIRELTGSRFIAAILTLAVFTLGHVSYWGIVQVLGALGAGLVLTVLYVWRRDLACNIIAHFLTDAVSVLLR